ncbi:adenylyl cyclase X E isoform X3 [Drosophila mojavensis]|uniref:adenylate cyclase n=1 Tax=Drosophila mojavensis TaxID=7230 RepID=A0A0Q9XEH8_DROMO|nr:adenylyl cyclase X E isoform X3 [Drosophila mojavensis]KRG06797.1 uncharacterized protein Dmoj_GI13944, isoform F [Drosophila mojavensis]
MICQLNYTKEIKWDYGFLTKKCKDAGIEDKFDAHQMRLRANYVGVFLMLHLFFTILHCTLLLTTCVYLDLIYIDVFCYVALTAVIIAVMWPNINVEFVMRHKFMMSLTSMIAVMAIVSVDLLLNYFHNRNSDWILETIFDVYIILMIYMFFPIPYVLATMLAFSVTITYITYFGFYLGVEHRKKMGYTTRFNQFIVELCNYICLNMMGTYFRVMREIVVRASLLDRHQYVMEDTTLRSARAQERVFLHSILPPQIAEPIQDDIRKRLESMEKQHKMPSIRRTCRIISIQIHTDVTILYADIVNYTMLTTKLPVKRLIALLHALYARFDKAASKYAVQRIKFLGDCYYCVAGLINPDPNHAKCCVDLGLCMIDSIREIRDKVKIDVDMRVGVHSGELFAGVLGAAKLQYDIWDVLIANQLESTGMPGQIHVSERTLQMTDDRYKVYPGTDTARKDHFLRKFNVVTFLITGIDENKTNEFKSFEYLGSTCSIKETNDNGLSLDEELKKMPLGPKGLKEVVYEIFNFKHKKEQKGKSTTAKSEIGSFLLHFHDSRLEYKYIHQPDYMLKYSVLLAWCCGMTLIYVQLFYNQKKDNFSVYVDIVLIITLSMLLFITWYKKICHWRYSTMLHTYSPFTCFLFKIADSLQRSLINRIGIYMYFIISYFCIIALMLNDCDRDEFQLMHIDSIQYKYEPDFMMCFAPWTLTCMVCLIIMMSIIFTRIPFNMRIFIGLLEAISYLIIMFYQYEYVVHTSLTTNPYFLPEYAHCLLILVTLLVIFFKERQTEFDNKINYKWSVELIKKQDDSRIAAQSITILLHNILPAHVVNVYLTSLAKHELYYESYDMVAVMFASLKNFELTLPNLRVLNEIISEFDQILSYYRDKYRVEKIKIVGSTYMAACGLDVQIGLNIKNETRSHDSLIQEVQRARLLLAAFQKKHYSITDEKEEVVFVLTTFALDLMRTLWVCNNDYRNIPIDRDVFNADMSIGISSGEVMAGVVGASQVQYDIWGHAANMASRMDSTGVAGKIHVTQNTALILKKYGIECKYRGMTYVKGQGILPTYFVDIDANYEFNYTQESYDSIAVESESN